MQLFPGTVLTALLLASANSVADIHSSTAADDETDAPELYRVKTGDTLWEISENYYGTPAIWEKISKDNDVPVPIHLQPGKMLNLAALQKAAPKSFPGVVTHLTGTVWHEVDGQRQRLREGHKIRAGDLLESNADGFVAIRFADGANITLPSNTRVTLETRKNSGGVSVELVEGEVESRIPRRESGEQHFDVVTPTGNLGVRGTHFRVAYHDSAATTATGLDDMAGTTTSVLEGLVDASFDAGQADVAAGQGVWEKAGRFGVVKLLPSPRLESTGNGLDDTLTLMLSKVDGAKRYRVQLATDAEFYRVVRDTSETTRELEFADLDEGLYYLRFIAIDGEGVEGMPGSEVIFYQPAGAWASYRQGEWIFNWNTQPRSSYRLQLSAAEDFSNLIVDREMQDSKGAHVRNLPAGVFFWRVSMSHADEDASQVIGSGKLDAKASHP